MRWAFTFLTGLGAALAASLAHGMPIVAVDLDPATPAVESVRSVTPGSRFTVDVVVIDVDSAAPLNGFELDIAYDPARVSAVALREGGFLLPTVLEVQSQLGPPEIGAAFATEGPGGAAGSGVLASIDFIAGPVGTTLLDLNQVLLSAPFGVAILTAEIRDGAINVVPEPGVAVLLGLGLAALGGWRRAHG